jgi:dodecin
MSVYRVTDVIRTSTQSWENAAATAVKTAAGTLRDLRAAEEAEQDLHLEQGGEITFRTKLRLPFKHDIAYAHAHQQNSQPGASRPDPRRFRPGITRPPAPLTPGAPGLIPASAPRPGCRTACGRPAASAGHRWPIASPRRHQPVSG